MNKVAKYLNEHLKGEVDTRTQTRQAFSVDKSVLSIKPDMVIYPRATVDIRKTARFAWRLAETGHSIGLTARGSGSDSTGAAIGKDIIINTTAHLNNIFELDPRQRLVRLQPGVTMGALNQALRLHELYIPAYSQAASYGTVGGAIANNASGVLSGKYGDMLTWTHQLEVVLSNGDLMQTERISKKALNRKKGEQTLEGEIYRKIDGLIEDNLATINGKIAPHVRDNVGYSGIADVKHRDGSFDLTPLLLGSQGTLAIISEMIMKAELASSGLHAAIAVFPDLEKAHDCIEGLFKLEPAAMELIDGSYFKAAQSMGKKYLVLESIKEIDNDDVVLVLAFDESSARERRRRLRKAVNLALKFEAEVVSGDEDDARDVLALREVTGLASSPQVAGAGIPPILDGFHVPLARIEDFSSKLKKLAKKHSVDLNLYGHVIEEIFYLRPVLHLKKVSDRQRVIKLIDECTALIESHGGHLVAKNGEGRLKASAAYKNLDPDVRKIFQEIKNIFDPHGIMNPGVKSDQDVKLLARLLRSEYDDTSHKNFAVYN